MRALEELLFNLSQLAPHAFADHCASHHEAPQTILPADMREEEPESLITAPSPSAFPRLQVGRLLHYEFQGLLSVHLCYNLRTRQVAKRPSTPEAPAASLPPPPLRLLPGGAIQFPGGSSSRCGPAPFHGAL